MKSYHAWVRSRFVRAAAAAVVLLGIGVVIRALMLGDSPALTTPAATERAASASALARAVDPALGPGCLQAATLEAAAAYCDTTGAGPSMSAPGFAARRTPRAVVLIGHRPIGPGTRVKLLGLAPTRRAQLIVLYRGGPGVTYARFSRLPAARTATVLAGPRSGGAPNIRLRYGGRTRRPSFQRTLSSDTMMAWLPGSPFRDLTAAVQPFTPPAQWTSCGSSPVSATCDRFFEALWHREGPGWTGGDGALSVPLRDGDDAWLFGDSFLGTVGSDDARPLSSPIVHNSIALQRGTKVITYTGPDGESIVADPVAGSWYWPGHGVLEGNHLRVFLQQFRLTGPGPFDFEFVDTVIASFGLPGIAYEGLTPIAHSQGITWGHWILEDGPWTYIYGTPTGGGNTALVARAPRDHVQSSWRYFDGSKWSASPQDAAPIATGVPNMFSVTPVRGGYALISMGPTFSPRMFARFGRTPQGPFGARRLIYTAPTPADTFVYGAVAHPEHTEGGRLLVSYSINSWRPGGVCANVQYYRPRYIRVPLAALAGGSSDS